MTGDNNIDLQNIYDKICQMTSLSIYIYISIINLSCLSVCVSLTMRPIIKMLTWVILMKVKDHFFRVRLSVCLFVCAVRWEKSQKWHFLISYNREMIWPKDIKLKNMVYQKQYKAVCKISNSSNQKWLCYYSLDEHQKRDAK